jgi:predicted NUDIX family NTP pyrophosphohydrolase
MDARMVNDRSSEGAIRAKRSAGLMMFRRRDGRLEVFLVHPGGPFFARRDEGVWTIPKGEIEGDASPIETARREFAEETGRTAEDRGLAGDPIPLGSVRQAGGKVVEAWAFEGDWPDGLPLESNRFTLEWPPRSGRTQSFPEVDRGEFFDAALARRKINPAQATFVDRLEEALASRS